MGVLHMVATMKNPSKLIEVLANLMDAGWANRNRSWLGHHVAFATSPTSPKTKKIV